MTVEQLASELLLIKKDIDYIKTFIEEDRERMREHMDTSEGYRQAVTRLNELPKIFSDHVRSDHWIQGTLLVTQVAIFGALVKLIVR